MRPASTQWAPGCDAGFWLFLLVGARSLYVAQALLRYPWKPRVRIGAQGLEEFRGFRVFLKVKRLLIAFCQAVGSTAPVVARVDVGAMLDQDLDHFVQSTVGRTVKRGEVG